MTKQKLFLGLILSMCFSVGVSAQDAAQETEKPATEKVEKKKGKKTNKGKKRKEKMVANIAKQFSAIEMSDEQTAKLTELVDEHYETMTSVQKQLDELVPKDKREVRAEAIKKARKEGMKRQEAIAAGFEAIEMSEEDQEKFVELNKSRTETLTAIKEQLAETFTEEQKELLAAAKPKRGKGKGKKKKKDADGELVSVSVKLPGMT